MVYRRLPRIEWLPRAFYNAIEATAVDALRQGLSGWPVVDCEVTLERCGYVPQGSTARDFRHLTPMVLMSALHQAGTTVCEPVERFELEVPADTVSAVVYRLGNLNAETDEIVSGPIDARILGRVPLGSVYELSKQLPGLTRGEATLVREFAGFCPVRVSAPVRTRTDGNPLDRPAYLLYLRNRGSAGPN